MMTIRVYSAKPIELDSFLQGFTHEGENPPSIKFSSRVQETSDCKVLFQGKEDEEEEWLDSVYQAHLRLGTPLLLVFEKPQGVVDTFFLDEDVLKSVKQFRVNLDEYGRRTHRLENALTRHYPEWGLVLL